MFYDYYDLRYICAEYYNNIKYNFIEIEFSNSTFIDFEKPKILQDQIADRRPINNPIQGRCY